LRAAPHSRAADIRQMVLEGMCTSEIAEALGISKGGVYTTANRYGIQLNRKRKDK